MKIHPNVPTQTVLGVAATPEPRSVERTPEVPPAHRVLVSLSGDARWVALVTEGARTSPQVRQEVVEAVKAALAAGTFEASVDETTLLENVLADL
jgi:anti-sigma28 factor (negative regulator of flagellin synthesis)